MTISVAMAYGLFLPVQNRIAFSLDSLQLLNIILVVGMPCGTSVFRIRLSKALDRRDELKT